MKRLAVLCAFVAILPAVLPSMAVAQASRSSAARTVTERIPANYFEGSADGANGHVFDGTVAWHLSRNALTKGAKPQTSLIAEITIPSRGMAFEIKISSNNDPAWPAVFIVQALAKVMAADQTALPASMIGLMAAPDKSEAVPMDGAVIRAAPGLFLMALADPTVEKGREALLLKRTPWFDMVFKFADDRRAKLRFYKGEHGGKAFEQAFRQWAIESRVRH